MRRPSQHPVATDTPSAKHPSVSTTTRIRLSARGTWICRSSPANKPIRTPSTCRGHNRGCSFETPSRQTSVAECAETVGVSVIRVVPLAPSAEMAARSAARRARSWNGCLRRRQRRTPSPRSATNRAPMTTAASDTVRKLPGATSSVVAAAGGCEARINGRTNRISATAITAALTRSGARCLVLRTAGASQAPAMHTARKPAASAATWPTKVL